MLKSSHLDICFLVYTVLRLYKYPSKIIIRDYSTPNVGDSCLFSYLVILNRLEMDVVQELDLSSESDSSESDGGDVQDEVSGQLASSCSELQTDPAGEGSTDIIQKKARSLMDVLKCPQPSSLVRKRVITKNNPPTGKRRCKSTNDRKAATSIKPQQRVEEFKGENLCVSGGKLFCNACREELTLYPCLF